MDFFESLGVPLKVERGRRVFPVSDKSSDIIRALSRSLTGAGVDVRYNCAVMGLDCQDNAVCGVFTGKGRIPADAVVLATGGLSYPSTGSTGDGHRFAKDCGHTIAPLYPSLTPVILSDDWVPGLSGLTLKNVGLTAEIKNGSVKRLKRFHAMGELLFTHTGISGPTALNLSRYLAGQFGNSITASVDLKPGLTADQLDTRLLRDFNENPNKIIGNILPGLVPRILAPVVAAASGIPAERYVCETTKQNRRTLSQTLKNLPITPVGTAGYAEAVITAGGVSINEVNPADMSSKKASGLYIAGELLDVDALTGGYNLQIAFSTGYLAGKAAGLICG
jgi:hypothetical protein